MQEAVTGSLLISLTVYLFTNVQRILKTESHWEVGLVSSLGNTHIATLVDRKYRFTIILKLACKDAESVHQALLAAFKKVPPQYKKSLTWDRGMELVKHADLTKEIGLPVCFCDPRCPWLRDTNKNTNSLIRQYFPKTLTCSHVRKRNSMT
jgi:IS30 family transposase